MTVCGIKHADGVCVMGKCPYFKMCCPAVWDKSGKVEMTNEEWFCSLSTEEKAEVLFDIWYDGKVLAWDKSKPFYFNRFVTWLKEVHKDEM